MDRTTGVGHQSVQASIGVTEDASSIWIVLQCSLPQGTAGLIEPVLLRQAAHLPLGIANRGQQGRCLAGETSFPHSCSELQHRPLVPHHLCEGCGFSSLHREHRTALFSHRRQLGRITDKDQSRPKRMGALKGNPKQGAVHHRRLIDQHQPEIFEGHRRLFGGLAEFGIG